jgi:hypothetical protein
MDLEVGGEWKREVVEKVRDLLFGGEELRGVGRQSRVIRGSIPGPSRFASLAAYVTGENVIGAAQPV